MNDKLRKGMVFSLLGLAVLFGGYNLIPQYLAPVSESQSPSVELDDQANSLALTSAPATNPPIGAKELESKKWGQDPFRTKPTNKRRTPRTKIGPKQWLLSGIVYSDINSLAIINSRTVGRGDFVDGAKVIRIGRKEVLMDLQGSRFTLKVNKG